MGRARDGGARKRLVKGVCIMRRVFRISVFLAAFSVVVAGIPKASQAVIINGSFEGEVSFARSAPGGIGVGDSVSGTFSWDTDTAIPNLINPHWMEYFFLPQPNNFFSIMIGGLEWASGAGLRVVVNDDHPIVGDRLSVVVGSNPASFPGALGGSDNAAVSIGGDELVTDIFTGLDLPTALNDAALLAVDPCCLGGPINSFVNPLNPTLPSWSFDFRVDPSTIMFATTVPEPATLALFSFGLIGAVVIRSRRRI